MGKLENHQSARTTKMLLIGDSGAGKTGALVSLVLAGYNLRILDLDNGLDILANVLKGKKEGATVEYETITDSMKNAAGKLVPAKATVWNRAVSLLQNWKTETADLGPLTSWGERDVLVIDTLTTLGKAAMAFNLSMNGRLGQAPQQSDWYQGQQLVESLLQMLFDENVKCNVIVNCHIKYIGEDGGPQRGYPETSTGQALSPKVGLYFNSALMVKTTGMGSNQKRKIVTNTAGIVELKNSNPGKVKPEYDQATGLAEFFRDLKGA